MIFTIICLYLNSTGKPINFKFDSRCYFVKVNVSLVKWFYSLLFMKIHFIVEYVHTDQIMSKSLYHIWTTKYGFNYIVHEVSMNSIYIELLQSDRILKALYNSILSLTDIVSIWNHHNFLGSIQSRIRRQLSAQRLAFWQYHVWSNIVSPNSPRWTGKTHVDTFPKIIMWVSLPRFEHW